MNPNFYRSASPQPSSVAAAVGRDHAAARAAAGTLYQNPYAAQEMMRLHSLATGASPYGFPGHPHPGASQFFQAPAGFHMAEVGSRNNLELPRSGSPPRRRPTMTDYQNERERYVRNISPSGAKSPNVAATQQQRHLPQNHPRPPSPRQMQHHMNNNSNSNFPSISATSSSRHEYRDPRSDAHEQQQQRYTSTSSSQPPKKISRMSNEQNQNEMSVQDYPRSAGGGMIGKPELRNQNQNQEHLARPYPLEAISPPTTEESNEVERLLLQVQAEIKVLDKNMNDCELNVHQLEAELRTAELRKEEHEKARRSHLEATKPDTPGSGIIGDLARRIISENRKISEAEHKEAGKKFNLSAQLPLMCHHPSDFSDVIQVLKDYQKQRPGIILRLKKDRQAKQIRERYLKERYKQLSQAYMSRLEKIETNPKKKNREAKMREYYERQFPEIKKIREDKLRDCRTGPRIKGDSEAEGPATGSGTDDATELEKFHRNAVLVPMLLDAKDRSRHFFDRNRLVENCANDYKESIANSFWTQEEKDIFKEKYLQRPKDFGYISSFLKRKSVQDCVQYYYLTKRKEGYKQMVKKQKAYRIRRGPNKRLQSTDEPVSPSKSLTSPGFAGSSMLRLSVASEARNDVEDVRAITLTIVCPAKKCQARRRAIKRLFKAPCSVPNYISIAAQIEMPDNATSCCKYCVHFLEKRLGMKKWSAAEIDGLKNGLANHGLNWNLIAKDIATKRLRDCVQYYSRHVKDLAPPAGDRPQPTTLPAVDDEYSPFSFSSSSDEEPSSQTNDAGGLPNARTDTAPLVRNNSEDSNATLSADEDEADAPPLPQPNGNSFSPGQLPVCESRGTQGTHSYVSSPDPFRMAERPSPACVRDLIHSAIEKNLDNAIEKARLKPRIVSEEFRRQLEAATSVAAGSAVSKDRYAERRGDVDVAALAESSLRGLHIVRGSAPPPNVKSPNRLDVAQPSGSPGRRDMSPHMTNAEILHEMVTGRPLPPMSFDNIRSPPTNQQQPQAYQYSTRQNLLTDFATSRQLHAEQVGQGHGDGRQGPYDGPSQQQQPHQQQPDPRYMPAFYTPYMYMQPQIQYTSMLTPEYMESLAASGLMQSMGLPSGNVANMMPSRSMVTPQRSIMLGTGRPGGLEDQPTGAGEVRESSNRLQTLAANRSLLRDPGVGSGNGDKRKPEVITIDEPSRRDGNSQSPLPPDMRFHPAPHHHIKGEPSEKDNSNPNLTAGSLIDVIITRQISNASRGGEQQGTPGPSASPSSSSRGAPSLPSLPPAPGKRDEPASSHHKRFTLGEHIEQIIANDFNRKDSIPPPAGMGSPGGVVVSPYQHFSPRMVDPANWKRRPLRVDDPVPSSPSLPPSQPSYQKPSTSLASTVEYEPISPPERETSDSGDDSPPKNGLGGDK